MLDAGGMEPIGPPPSGNGPARPQSRPGLAALALPLLMAPVILIVSAWCVYAVLFNGGIANDFRVFWSTARSASPYAPGEWPFVYPPTMLVYLTPLRLLNLGPAFALWTCLSVGFYIATIRPIIGKWWPCALAVMPGIFALLTGQVSLIVAALIFLAFRSRHPGLILGIAFTIKPQLVLLAPLAFLLVREWRQLILFAAAILAISALATAQFGVQSWLDWIGSFDHFRQRANEIGVLRAAVSPSAIAERFGLAPVPFLIGGIVLGCTTLVRAYPAARDKGPLLALSSILCSPYALSYDLVAVMPLVIPHLVGRPDARTLPAFLAVTFLFQIIGTIGLAAMIALRPDRPPSPEPAVR